MKDWNDEQNMFNNHDVVFVRVFGKHGNVCKNDAYLKEIQRIILNAINAEYSELNTRMKNTIADQHEGGLSGKIETWLGSSTIDLRPTEE